MQDATANFALAVSSATVAWLPAQVFADWAQDGYGATESIDDLSGQAGNITVNQALDDGLPDEVAFAADDPVPTLTVDLGGRADATPARYFSPFRTDSPVYGYERDVAPVKVDHGLVTSAGREHVRVFTGQMADVPVVAGKATLQGVSATRLALADLVQPPVVEPTTGPQAIIYGLTATWPVSYTLHACGIYPSPPAQVGCRLWIPMHGGGNSFIPSTNVHAGLGAMFGVSITADTSGLNTPTAVRGPYVGAGFASSTDTEIVAQEGQWFGFDTTRMAAGSDWFSTAGNVGRVQFWVRGDAASVNTAPGGSATFGWGLAGLSSPIGLLAGLQASCSPDTAAFLTCGVRASDRKVAIQVYDGTHNVTVATSAALPTDGAWHFVGAAWDVANNKLWVNLDGVVTTNTPSPALTTAALQPNHTGVDDVLALIYVLPFAEVQFTTGAVASPTNTPAWLNTATWTQGADVYPSSMGLSVVAEPQPREAWEYLSSLAQADMAAVRIDETDVVRYWPRGYFATIAGQTVAETIDTHTGAARPDVQVDRSRVRNVARVTYQQTTVDDYLTTSRVLNVTTRLPIGPGTTLVSFPLDTSAIAIVDASFGPLAHLTAAQIAGTDPIVSDANYVSLNTSPDGSGDYSVAADVVVTVESWDAGQVVVQFANATGITWYLANTGDSPVTDLAFLSVVGRAITAVSASVTEQYDASVAVRGPRAIVVDLPQVQSEVDATRVARRLLGDLAFPQPVIPSVAVFGDPRRQPGDLLIFEDDAETGADGQWRSWSVKHQINGADYQQTLRLAQARSTGRWGDGVSRWGRTVWAGQEVDA